MPFTPLCIFSEYRSSFTHHSFTFFNSNCLDEVLKHPLVRCFTESIVKAEELALQMEKHKIRNPLTILHPVKVQMRHHGVVRRDISKTAGVPKMKKIKVNILAHLGNDKKYCFFFLLAATSTTQSKDTTAIAVKRSLIKTTKSQPHTYKQNPQVAQEEHEGSSSSTYYRTCSASSRAF